MTFSLASMENKWPAMIIISHIQILVHHSSKAMDKAESEYECLFNFAAKWLDTTSRACFLNTVYHVIGAFFTKLFPSGLYITTFVDSLDAY